jgi:hypothetical protein
LYGEVVTQKESNETAGVKANQRFIIKILKIAPGKIAHVDTSLNTQLEGLRKARSTCQYQRSKD